jgi:ribosomal protein S18 acetylase RimI-like enzyme
MTSRFLDEPIQQGDIAFVAHNLWGRGREEFVLHGIEAPEELRARIEGMVDEHSRSLLFDDLLVAVCGVNQVEPDVFSTWFLATEDFARAAFAATRFLRKMLKAKTEEHPLATVVLVSANSHPDARRWFEALGFEWKNNQGVFSNYEYIPRIKAG